MNELQVFNNEEFGNVRVFPLNGEPWFVGVDVAKALQYSNPTKAVRAHTEGDERMQMMLGGAEAQNGLLLNMTKTNLINESGLYSLIMSSKLPTAKKFRKWITSEVIPSIRKTGSYSLAGSEQTALSTYLELMREQMERVVQSLKSHGETIASIDSMVKGRVVELEMQVKSLQIEVEQMKSMARKTKPEASAEDDERGMIIEIIPAASRFLTNYLMDNSYPFNFAGEHKSLKVFIVHPLPYSKRESLRKRIEDSFPESPHKGVTISRIQTV